MPRRKPSLLRRRPLGNRNLEMRQTCRVLTATVELEFRNGTDIPRSSSPGDDEHPIVVPWSWLGPVFVPLLQSSLRLLVSIVRAGKGGLILNQLNQPSVQITPTKRCPPHRPPQPYCVRTHMQPPLVHIPSKDDV